MLAKAVAGDYTGAVAINTGVLWTGPRADKFRGFTFIDGNVKYQSSQIRRVVYLDEEKSKSFLGSAVGGIAGGLLLGPAGLVAGTLVGGTNKKVVVNLGLEFDDGKKVILSEKSSDKGLECLILWAREQKLLEQDLGF